MLNGISLSSAAPFGCGSMGCLCYITCSLSFPYLTPCAFNPPSLSPIAGCIHIDKRLKEITSQLERGEEVKGGVLTHMLTSKEMSIEEIYANVTEMLLAGVDTVRAGLSINVKGPAQRGV